MLNDSVLVLPQSACDRTPCLAIVELERNGCEIEKNGIRQKFEHKVIGILRISLGIFHPKIDEFELRLVQHEYAGRKSVRLPSFIRRYQRARPVFRNWLHDATLHIEPKDLAVTLHHFPDIRDLEIKSLNQVIKFLSETFTMNRITQRLAVFLQTRRETLKIGSEIRYDGELLHVTSFAVTGS